MLSKRPFYEKRRKKKKERKGKERREGSEICNVVLTNQQRSKYCDVVSEMEEKERGMVGSEEERRLWLPGPRMM